MDGVALKMLFGDQAKYIGLIFSIAFSTMLMSNQVSIFAGLMLRTASQILDAREADIWVMDPRVEYVDEVEPMTDTQLDRVRGVDGVDWAVPFFKGLTVAHTRDGFLQQVTLFGVDDATLIGVTPRMVLGSVENLKQPDALIIDRAGFQFMWPGEKPALGKVIAQRSSGGDRRHLRRIRALYNFPCGLHQILKRDELYWPHAQANVLRPRPCTAG
jgi:putative ABC transport system permease protein